MKKSAFISDILFAFFASFIFTLCLFRFLGIPLVLSCFLAILCGILLSCSVWALLSFKRKKYFLKRADEEQKEKLLFHLALLEKKSVIELFAPLLESTPLQKSYLQTKKELFFIHCSFSPVTQDEVADFFRLQPSKKHSIYCSNIEPAARSLCSKLQLEVKNEKDIYLLFKEQNAFPKEFLGDVQTEKLPFYKRKATFAKANSKRFLVSGCFLLLSSLITPFPYYYLIFGSVLLFAAAFTRIFGQ